MAVVVEIFFNVGVNKFLLKGHSQKTSTRKNFVKLIDKKLYIWRNYGEKFNYGKFIHQQKHC